MDSLTYLQLLRRNRSFRRLWWGQVISELGNWFNFIAGLGLVRMISHGDAAVTTIMLLGRMVPFTLFAPLAGAFVDRWSRRMVMIVSDLARVAVAIGFLLVHRPEDLWIAYLCTALLSVFGAFFEAAKSAAMPNITGERDLLAGNALMFSSRFLLMSLGAALGGWTAANVGYRAAFVVNAISFLGSALSVWLIPERETKQLALENTSVEKKPSYWSDIREGWSYIISHAPVAAILTINVLWASGGGAVNLILDRLGGIVFAGQRSISGDSAVAALYFAGGIGLFIGMMIARRLGHYFEFLGKTPAFIGWGLLLQGFLFALIGVMPNLWFACLFLFLGRIVLGAEFGVQDTLLMRLVPDKLRGRVLTTDRATELLTWSLSTTIAGWSLRGITPRTLTVISGLLSALSGAVWLVLFASGRVRLPRKFSLAMTTLPKEAADSAA
ncbi:MAG TPA: MFS transporter [Pyrinomonadaceae bacterium]|jgi:MFS family permease|nr:MFS transporter [Pyrinomonadaceae bacterium]